MSYTHWAPHYLATKPYDLRRSVCGVFLFRGGSFRRGVNYCEYEAFAGYVTCPLCLWWRIRSAFMQRFVATITRLNGVSFEIHINTHSLEQATRIARDLLRDGETLVVESAHG